MAANKAVLASVFSVAVVGAYLAGKVETKTALAVQVHTDKAAVSPATNTCLDTAVNEISTGVGGVHLVCDQAEVEIPNEGKKIKWLCSLDGFVLKEASELIEGDTVTVMPTPKK